MNKEKVKKNMQLPYLVSNIVEVIDPQDEGEEDGATADMNAEIKEKAVVIKTSTRKVPLVVKHRLFIWRCLDSLIQRNSDPKISLV